MPNCTEQHQSIWRQMSLDVCMPRWSSIFPVHQTHAKWRHLVQMPILPTKMHLNRHPCSALWLITFPLANYSQIDWMHAIPGRGHLRNEPFQLNLVPFLEKLAEVMRFRYEAAKNYVRNCIHKNQSFKFVLAFHIGSLREMVLPYVRQQLKDGANSTALGFNCCAQIQND